MFFARLFGVELAFDEAVVDADNLGIGKVSVSESVNYPWNLIPIDDWR